MKRGYARVSREDQVLDRQIEALQAAGCEDIYWEKVSGAKEKRVELEKLLTVLQPGDSVVIHKLDRLGRSLKHLMQLSERFERMNVGLISLTEGFDTNTPGGRMLFQMIGAIAEFERAMISERTRSALRTKARQGVKLGRKEKDRGLLGSEIERLNSEDVDIKTICKQLSISKNLYYQIKKGL